MPTPQKEALVEEFGAKLADAKSLVLADFTGLDVEQATALRSDLRKRNVQYRVIKNTLLRLACRKSGHEALEPYLEGPTALAFSVEDEVEPARALVEFAKEHERPVVKAGLVGTRLYTMEEILELAKLPGRQELLAQVLGTVIAPMSQLLGAVNALLGAPAGLAGELERKQQG